jgi:hypothetical protein
MENHFLFFASENYLIRWGSNGMPKEIEKLNNLQAIFTVSPTFVSLVICPLMLVDTRGKCMENTKDEKPPRSSPVGITHSLYNKYLLSTYWMPSTDFHT